MRVYKVYISGKITGTNDYMQRFDKTERRLNSYGYDVFNPAKTCSTLPESTSYKDYMKICMCMLNMCDAIYMMNGWKESKGANAEYAYAKSIGLNIIYETEPIKED